MHHSVQCAGLEWASDFDGEAARATRLALLEPYEEGKTLVLGGANCDFDSFVLQVQRVDLLFLLSKSKGLRALEAGALNGAAGLASYWI